MLRCCVSASNSGCCCTSACRCRASRMSSPIICQIARTSPPAAAPATPSAPGTRASSAARSRSSSSPRGRSGSRSGGTRRRAADRRAGAPARSPLRAARRATCADRRRPSRPRSSARRLVRRARHARRERAVGAVHVEPDVVAPADIAAISASGSTAPVLTVPAVPTTRNGTIAVGAVGDDLPLERGDVHALLGVGGDPANRVGAQPEQVGGLLDPGVRFGRRVDAQRRRASPRSPAVRTSGGFGGAGGEEADEVRHVAAAHQQAAAVGRKPDQLGNPADGLRFDLGGHRRQPPCADVLVDGRRQQIAERADGRRARRDVAEEPRMSVEQRVLEEQSRGFVEQRARVGADARAASARRCSGRGRRLATRRASPGRRAAAPASRRSDRPGRGRLRGKSAALMSSGASRPCESRAFFVGIIAVRRTDPFRVVRPPFTRLNAR